MPLEQGRARGLARAPPRVDLGAPRAHPRHVLAFLCWPSTAAARTSRRFLVGG